MPVEKLGARSWWWWLVAVVSAVGCGDPEQDFASEQGQATTAKSSTINVVAPENTDEPDGEWLTRVKTSPTDGSDASANTCSLLPGDEVSIADPDEATGGHVAATIRSIRCRDPETRQVLESVPAAFAPGTRVFFFKGHFDWSGVTIRNSCELDSSWRPNFSPPVSGRITSPFGERPRNFHWGLDIAAPMGTHVRAPEKGKVIDVEEEAGACGNTLTIQHPDGSKTRYCHNGWMGGAKLGKCVKKGEIVSVVAMTGTTTGPHLHVEYYPPSGGKPVDPQRILGY